MNLYQCNTVSIVFSNQPVPVLNIFIDDVDCIIYLHVPVPFHTDNRIAQESGEIHLSEAMNRILETLRTGPCHHLFKADRFNGIY